jgi:hypothetical protein
MTGLILVVADGFRRNLYSIRASRYGLIIPGSGISRGLIIRRVQKVMYPESVVAHEGELCYSSRLDVALSVSHRMNFDMRKEDNGTMSE